MPRILQLETATAICSVSLAENGVVTGLEESEEKNNHASRLHVFIDRLLQQKGIDYPDLDAIAVSMGPGSYTGLRIGVAAAKGFGFALDIPVIAVNTLQSMTEHYICKFEFKASEDALFCPMIDARRMEVYTALYDRNLTVIKPVTAMILDENAFREELRKHKIHFFGDGADKFRKLSGGHPKSQFRDDFSTSSRGLTRPALEAYNARQFIDLAYFEPYYLKDFVAGPAKRT